MAQSRDLVNLYGEEQLLLQRLSKTCARIEAQLQRNQHVLSPPIQTSVATPLRAQDQSVDILDLPMPVTTSISIPPASTSPTIRQWEPDNRPIQIPQPAFVKTASAQAQRSSSQAAASQPQQRAPLVTSAGYAASAEQPVRMPDARYLAPELHGGVFQSQPMNHVRHFSAHETTYASCASPQPNGNCDGTPSYGIGQAKMQQQWRRNVMSHSN